VILLELLPVAYLAVAAALPPLAGMPAALAPLGAGTGGVLALLALRRLLLRAPGDGRAGRRVAAEAALGAAYALAAASGALLARPLLHAAGPWAAVAWGAMAFLFAPFAVVALEARGGRPRPAPRPRRPGRAERIRLAGVALACALLGLALVLARLPGAPRP